jgi:hypothetical protein
MKKSKGKYLTHIEEGLFNLKIKRLNDRDSIRSNMRKRFMPTLQTRKDKQHENLCEELLRERAAVLSRAGYAVEDALDRLMQIEQEIETKISLLKSFRTQAHDREILDKQKLLHEEINLNIDQFNNLCRNAQLKYYYLIVTREALGLRRHGMIKEIYRIPSIRGKIQAI